MSIVTRSVLTLVATLAAALAGTPTNTKAADKALDKAPAATAVDKPAEPLPSRVRVDTNLGSFTIQFELSRAPLTVSNFMQYVRDGHYNGLLFHRVVGNFIVQAGGYDKSMNLRTTIRTVANESGNGLSNRRGTVGLARTEAAHSGNAQFYVNLTDNEELDPTPLRWGYAVFGKVTSGMDTIDKIRAVPTGRQDVPVTPILINSATLVK